MNKEEILAKSRQENKDADERETQIKLKAISISRSVGIMLCFVILLLETIMLDTSIIGFACLTINFSMRATESWVTTLILKKKDTIPNVVVDTIFFVACAITFLVKLI